MDLGLPGRDGKSIRDGCEALVGWCRNFDPVGIVDDAIEDCIGERRIADRLRQPRALLDHPDVDA